MKVCTQCETSKPVSEFYIKDRKTNRIRSECKTCTKKNVYAHQVKNRERYRELANARRRKNREAINAARRAQRRDQIKERVDGAKFAELISYLKDKHQYTWAHMSVLTFYSERTLKMWVKQTRQPPTKSVAELVIKRLAGLPVKPSKADLRRIEKQDVIMLPDRTYYTRKGT